MIWDEMSPAVRIRRVLYLITIWVLVLPMVFYWFYSDSVGTRTVKMNIQFTQKVSFPNKKPPSMRSPRVPPAFLLSILDYPFTG